MIHKRRFVILFVLFVLLTSELAVFEFVPIVKADNTENYVDNNTSDVDSSPNKGTYSNFTAEQYGPDGIYDTLTEVNTNGNPDVYYLSSTSLTGFGTDYRALTTTSGTADTTTSIKHAKNTGYFYFDPFTSSSTGTGTPSATALKGYGWRSNGVYGKVIPAGTWEFNLTLQESSATGNGHIEIWVYSCTTSGTSVTNLFSIDATGTNVLATTATTKYTFTYTSTSSYDLTNLVLVVEYWLHVTVAGTSTTGTIKLTTVSADSSVKVPSPNYQLDLEFQWTSADYDETNEYLCIYAGTLDSVESLKVDVWNGAGWTNIIASLTANAWNNVSISSYLTSATITFRFLGGTETSDSTQSSWQIDCVLLHTWTGDSSWLSGWSYRKSHVINSASGAGTNYQVKITVHYGSGTDSGGHVYLNSHSRTDFGDVRFTDDDGTTLLDYWMESKVDSDYAIFWVEVADDLSSATATIYVYYGKSDATTTSNGKNTFLRFYDFSSDESGEWTKDLGSWSWNASQSRLEQGDTTNVDHEAHVSTGSALNIKLAVRARIQGYKAGSSAYIVPGIFFAWQTASDWMLWRIENTGSSQVYALRKKVGGVETLLASSSMTVNYNTYYILEARWISTALVKCYVDDVLKVTQSSNLPTWTTGREGTRWSDPGKTNYQYTDWILVRKCVDPEPSHGSWGSEETSGGVTYNRAAGQDVSITGSVSRINNVQRSLALTFQFLGTATKTVTFMRQITQAGSLQATVARLQTFTRALTQPLSLLASPSRTLAIVRQPFQSITLSTFTSRVATLFRVSSVISQVSIFTTVQKTVSRVSTLTLVSTAFTERILQSQRSTSEIVQLLATAQRTASIPRRVTQNLILNVISSRSITFPRNPMETFNVTFQTLRSIIAIRLQPQTFTLIPSTIRTISAQRQAFQTFSITSLTTRLASLSRTQTQQITLMMQTGRTQTFDRLVSTIFSSQASVIRWQQVMRQATSPIQMLSLAFSEKAGFYERLLQLTITVSPSATRIIQLSRVSTQSVTMITFVARTAESTRLITETVQTLATTLRTIQTVRTMPLNIMVTFQSARTVQISRLNSQSLTVETLTGGLLYAYRTATNQFAILVSVTSQKITFGIQRTADLSIIVNAIAQRTHVSMTRIANALFQAVISVNRWVFPLYEGIPSGPITTPHFEITVESFTYSLNVFQNNLETKALIKFQPLNSFDGNVTINVWITNTAETETFASKNLTIPFHTSDHDPTQYTLTLDTPIFWTAITNDHLIWHMNAQYNNQTTGESRVLFTPIPWLTTVKPFSPYALICLALVAIYIVFFKLD